MSQLDITVSVLWFPAETNGGWGKQLSSKLLEAFVAVSIGQ